MKPLIPVIFILGVFAISTILWLGGEILEISTERDITETNIQERRQEFLLGSYIGTPGNIQDAKVISQSLDDSKIVGIVVRCQNGDTMTIKTDFVISGGTVDTIPRVIIDKMEVEASRC